MRLVRGALRVIASLSALIILILTALELAIFDMKYVDSEMKKYQIAEELKMEEQDLHTLFAETLGYLKNERNDLVIQTVVDGQPVEAYNEREKLHMVDVKGLFTAGFRIRNLALGVFAVSILLLLILRFRKKQSRECERFSGTVVVTWGLVLLSIGILGWVISRDFDAAFIRFHEIFFNNDLWMLDPAESLMINMLPEAFFADMTLRIGLFVLVPVLVILAGCILVWCISRRKRKQKAEVPG